MACFIVPLTQAIATTLYRHNATKQAALNHQEPSKIVASLPRLEAMLWGGSAMLIVDHIINGELMPVFPFFSALATDGGAFTMLREMLIIGVPMSLLVTAIWAVTVALQTKRA